MINFALLSLSSSVGRAADLYSAGRGFDACLRLMDIKNFNVKNRVQSFIGGYIYEIIKVDKKLKYSLLRNVETNEVHEATHGKNNFFKLVI